ncbi:MAG TPA: GTP-binding protein [Anaerolineae bacterium]|nr:GTP-binding protein [Anaerolineae bacterium]
MLRIPATLNELRSLFKALDRESLSVDIEEETRSRLAVVGPANSGKSTLVNLLLGKQVSPVTAVPGTTKEVITQRLGPFTLTDTPGFGEVAGVERGETALAAMREADLAVLVFDGAAGLRSEDHELYQRLRAEKIPLVVTLNKIDLIGKDLPLVVADAQGKLGVSVVPISARKGTNVATMLLPRIVEMRPALAVALGRELPFYRRRMTRSVIRSASTLNFLIGMEPIPLLDIPLLLASQVRLTLRIAAIYGEGMGTARAKEFISTIGGGILLRFATQQALKFLPGPGWIISGSIAGAGTWAMGQVAVAYFESRRVLSATQMRELYGKLRKTRLSTPLRVLLHAARGLPWLIRGRLHR